MQICIYEKIFVTLLVTCSDDKVPFLTKSHLVWVWGTLWPGPVAVWYEFLYMAEHVYGKSIFGGVFNCLSNLFII